MAYVRSALSLAAHAGPSTLRHAVRTLATGSNPPLAFPCLDQHAARAERLLAERRGGATAEGVADGATAEVDGGPEPAYAKVVSGYETYRHRADPLRLDYGGTLPSFDIAYETWGKLNADKSNAILLHTGLSASSHARSHDKNRAEGWWERFIGPGRAIDTDRFFVICTNALGSCYGSTGPSSLDPSDGKAYATRFPILSIFDMIRGQLHLLDHLGIQRLYASVGSSMGGMQSVALAHLAPERVGKVVSISGSARSSPSSIALRYAQRSVLMADPNWNRGFYYDRLPPHTGMKLARQIATITYRSGPEWEQRFARRRRPALSSASFASPSSVEDPQTPNTPPVLCPDFLIETYLDHQGEQYDANSLIYVSKAMDLFDMSRSALDEIELMRNAGSPMPALCPPNTAPFTAPAGPKAHISSMSSSHAYLPDLTLGLANLARIPTLILGVQSDVLFPVEQQRELAEALRQNGNKQVTYFELDSPYGHDTFLIDLPNVGGALRGFL